VGVLGCALITTLADVAEVHPFEFVTVKLCVPSVKSGITVLAPLPVLDTLPGLRISVHDPVGKPLNTTLPVDMLHVGCVIVPITGGGGMAFTVSVNEATAAEHGAPKGLLVVIVIITVLPASAAEGVYVNEKGDVPVDDELTEPEPFSVIVTFVAEPPKKLLFSVKDVIPQVLPLLLLSATVGGFIHPHNTEKTTPVAVHPSLFLAVIV
jgi:hypothetical protein